MTRLNLVVVFGGQSAEHDVSCVTGAHVLRAIDPDRYTVTAIGIDREGHWHLAEDAMSALEKGPAALPGRLEPRGLPVSSAPVLSAAASTGTTVVLPLLHGPLGEDGTIQGMLELLDLPYVGSGVLSSAVCMDKAMAKDVLARHGIPQPKYSVITPSTSGAARLESVVRELGFPLFVKPANMGSSIGVSKVRTPEELRAALELAFSYDEIALIEEAVVCREIEVAILGNENARASVPGEIVPGNEFYDYDDKYVTDGAQLLVPADLGAGDVADVQQLALDVFRVLRCSGLARVDFFYEVNGRGFLCNEVNTMPGFTPISMYPKLWQASGVEYSVLIDRLVELALERHARRHRNTSR
ncbi:MAG: D-alanine--D-alanine ligase family protein [Ilumatobacteraceae bacterium]